MILFRASKQGAKGKTLLIVYVGPELIVIAYRALRIGRGVVFKCLT